VFEDLQTYDDIQQIRRDTQFREDQRKKPVRDHLNMNEFKENQYDDSSDSGRLIRWKEFVRY
jgi:hypothetical protein